jgi:hypothetical protein
MRKIFLTIITAAIIASCTSNTAKPLAHWPEKIDSVYGIASYLNSWENNDVRESRAVLYTIDSLKPDASDPTKNVLQKDSFFIVAVPSILVDSATRKPIKDSLGNNRLVLVDKLIPKESVYDFKPVRLRKKSK